MCTEMTVSEETYMGDYLCRIKIMSYLLIYLLTYFLVHTLDNITWYLMLSRDSDSDTVSTTRVPKCL